MGEPAGVTILDAKSQPSSATPRSDVSKLDLPAPETVLHRAEVEQARRTGIAGMLFNAAGLAVLPLLGGDRRAQMICGLALAVAFFNNAWLFFMAREPRYRERHLIIYFAIAPVLNAGVLYYLGVFGVVLAMFVLNVYTACLGFGRRVALVTLIGASRRSSSSAG